MGVDINIARAISHAENPLIKIRFRHDITEHGIIQYNTRPIHKTTNLSAFPVEKIIREHRVRAMPYQHWFRYQHALRLVRGNQPHVLDLGAGDCMIGHFLFQALRKCLYVGMDLDYSRLRAAIERGFGKLPYYFIQRDLTKKLPFLNNTFDYIFAYEVIEHIEKEQAEELLAHCYHVLKPGGVLSISTPNNRGEKIANKYKHLKVHGKRHVYEEHPYEWRAVALQKFLVKELGFKHRMNYGLDHDHIKHIGLNANSDSLELFVNSYFPTQIGRLILSLPNWRTASFVMIEVEK